MLKIEVEGDDSPTLLILTVALTMLAALAVVGALVWLLISAGHWLWAH